ncbi:MAG: MerR family transcriptional regulator [Pseudomonadota bacterium]
MNDRTTVSPEAKPTADQTYRISELVSTSGVSRDMIKYYLRAKLLPPAQKPRPNLSLYTDNHLQLITLIRRFQEQTRLSLPDIAAIFVSAAYDANAIELELLSARHSNRPEDAVIPIKRSLTLAHNLEVPEKFLQDLTEAGLLDPSDSLTEDEHQLAGFLWAASSAGVPFNFFKEARDKIAALADLEVKTLIAIKRPDLSYDDTVTLTTEVDHMINRWLTAEKSYRIRTTFQKVIDNSLQAISLLLESRFEPSHLFEQRYDIASLLDRYEQQALYGDLSAQQCRELCFAAFLVGYYDLGLRVAKHLLTVLPDDEYTTACLALVHGVQGNVDEAFRCGSRLDGSSDKRAVILQARILGMLLKAAKLGGLADTRELMKNAAELFLELPEQPPIHQPEATLFLARANVVFPDFANSRPQAITALETLLTHLDSQTALLDEFSLTDLRSCLLTVYRIYTLHYLGILYSMNREDASAKACFERVIQLDPASNFGEDAYLRLGRLT